MKTILPLVDESEVCVVVLAWLGVEFKTTPTLSAMTAATILTTISLILSKGGSHRADPRMNSSL
jgi:uncharacterized membrane protein YjjB (DUF3815 family)